MTRPISLSACCYAAWLALGCLSPGLLLLPTAATAQTSQRSTVIERQVKAAYLHKFTSFVEWPAGTFADAGSPIIIAVMGEDALADDLAAMVAGRIVNGRTLSVRKLERSDSLAGIHVLLMGRLEKNQLLEVFAALKGRPVLTVTDDEEAYALGSTINFVVTRDKLRFEVALARAEASQLKISALMLAAAYKVVKEGL